MTEEQKDSTGPGWFKEPERHQEAAIKGLERKGAYIAPGERAEAPAPAKVDKPQESTLRYEAPKEQTPSARGDAPTERPEGPGLVRRIAAQLGPRLQEQRKVSNERRKRRMLERGSTAIHLGKRGIGAGIEFLREVRKPKKANAKRKRRPLRKGRKVRNPNRAGRDRRGKFTSRTGKR